VANDVRSLWRNAAGRARDYVGATPEPQIALIWLQFSAGVALESASEWMPMKSIRYEWWRERIDCRKHRKIGPRLVLNIAVAPL